MTELEEQVVKLRTKTECYEKEFGEWRHSLCSKVTKILDKLEDLPCNNHHTDIELVKVEQKSIKSEYKRIGLYFIIVVVGLIVKMVIFK